MRLLSLRIALRPAFLRALHFVFHPAVISRVSYCAAYAFCGTSRKGKRGATRGKRPWGFPPRAFRAEECGRMHSRSALPEKFLEMIVFKNINIFRETALPERCVELNCFLKIIKII